ncbi:unnamed protein product (macronuclear) [Paramecium tetraurelia]|uniref:Uncharacterized protein n=1 Tax=Paramecium tetraurelia TaxID=5888 RepID=A0EF91_PARTE|nr:uncharacterized protein GSPATT00026305001 [Paramecium tetraurelia]CAK93982.1 unnamed protein product [Paramecium tetraurelia]|eukprot:XP_001461355.1 hypothetical protein (macronuclear) [Paramecium tetraurelia strain d4-2]
MLSVLKGERVLVIDFGALYKAIGLWSDDEEDDDNSNMTTKYY